MWAVKCLRRSRHLFRYEKSVRFISTGVMKSPYPDIELKEEAYHELLCEMQEKYANKTAVVSGETGQKYTYREVRDNAFKLGSALSRLGYAKGDIIALALPNCIQFPVVFQGVLSFGGTATTMNHSFTSHEMKTQLKTSKASAVICDSTNYKIVREAVKDLDCVRHLIICGAEKEGALSYENIISKDDGKGIPHFQINAKEDVATLPFSSGVTGLPKGVMLTHYNLCSNLHQFVNPYTAIMEEASETHQEKFVIALPMYHSYGQLLSIANANHFGACVFTMKQFDKTEFIHLHKNNKMTILPVTPPLLSFMSLESQMSPEYLSSVKWLLCGAAPAGPALFTQFQRKFGTHINLSEGFGLTETSPVTHMTPRGKLIFGSCGVPVPNTYTRIVNIETHEVLPLNSGIGEIQIKGPQVMKGYFNNEEATKAAITNDGWLLTGDLGRIDSNGYLYVVDRLKELIKVKGYQVPPAELENILMEHPDIMDVAVIGVPDRDVEAPKAFVVPKNKSLTAESVMSFVSERVSEYKRLTGGVQFIENIPKTPGGKILRRELREH